MNFWGTNSDLLDLYHVHPDIRFTTWEDFAIMAMVEKGMGISILPDLILKRVPYKIEIRPLEEPYYRSIGLAMKNRKNPDSRRSKIYRISAFQGDGVNINKKSAATVKTAAAVRCLINIFYSALFLPVICGTRPIISATIAVMMISGIM